LPEVERPGTVPRQYARIGQIARWHEGPRAGGVVGADVALEVTDRSMRRLESSCTALLALTIVAASPCSVHGAAVPLATARPHDPVVIRTAALTEVVDRDPTHYRLYVANSDRLVPIPFQVDARDAQGRYVFDETPGGGVGTPFDDDDELVFMAKDTGARIAPECLPGGSPPSEIEVRDPVTGARGYAYLVHDPEARSRPRPRTPLSTPPAARSAQRTIVCSIRRAATSSRSFRSPRRLVGTDTP
jgi:hypothetical protein